MVITADGMVVTYEEFLDMQENGKWFLKRKSLRKLRLLLFCLRGKYVSYYGILFKRRLYYDRNFFQSHCSSIYYSTYLNISYTSIYIRISEYSRMRNHIENSLCKICNRWGIWLGGGQGAASWTVRGR